MRTHTTTTQAMPRWRDRRLLGILVAAAVLLALAGICGVSQVVLFLVTPHGGMYPQSVLAKLGVDYGRWDSRSQIGLPPLNPQAALAAESDAASPAGTPGT